LDDLIARNVQNLSLRMSGWCNGGITQKVLTNVKVVRNLGGQAGMDRLIAKCKEENVPLYFEGVTAFAYDSNLLDGFLSYRDAARFTTREHIEVHPYDPITYTQMDWLDTFYLVRPQYAKKNASNLIESLSQAKATGVSFRDIGKFLSGNYNPKDTTSREKVKQMNLDTLQEAKDAGLNVMVKQGNDYVLPYANIITDMDLDGINYSILDRMVPFYEIAIHGMKDYTSSALNISGDYETQLLQCAEYGAGLNYTFFAENAQVLQDSVHTGYYGAEYAVWAEKAAADIERFQREMAGLNNQRIVDHAYLDKEVTMTRYADGTTVYVNYGKQDYNKGGLMVPARDYYVKGGDTK